MDRTEQEENKEKDIFRYLINKGIPYSASTLDEAETFTSKLQSAEKESYFDLEERFSAHPEVVKTTLSFISTLGGAPAVVLAFRDKPDYTWALLDEGVVQSVAASMENLVLSAYDHGVSSCWMTAANQAHMTKDLRDEFAPGHGELVGIIALGYNAAEEAPKAPKRKADKFVLI